jgi:ribose transport system permease protein
MTVQNTNTLPPYVQAADKGTARYRTLLADNLERFGLVAVWVLLILVFGVLRPETFLSAANWEGILGSQAVLVVLTIALLIPLNAGDYDLSVTGVLMLSQMLIGVLGAQDKWPLLSVLVICLASGLLTGAINALFSIVFRVDPFIVTLGTGTFLQGIVFWISGSNTISGISTTLINLVAVDRFLGIPLEFYYGLFLTIILWYVLEFTALGRRLLFVGRNRDVARLSGVRVGRVRCGALMASGLVAALAGILYAGTTGAADPVSGATYLLPAFAAAFLGSTTIAPGKFNSWGSFIATYFLITGITGLTLLGAQTYVQDLFYGGALVLAVTFSQLARRYETSRIP